MSISEKAMLVSLSIKQWTARKFDRQITEEVNSNHNSKDAGRFNKLLIAKERLSPIVNAANAIRIFHYNNTLAWADEGDRLLPVANFFEYSTKINALKDEFERATKDFIDDYHLIIDEARHSLNGLFNPMDYPSNISDRFAVRFSFMPVPDSNDFRINISKEELDGMRAKMNIEVNSRLENATSGLKDKLRDQLIYMRDRLADPNGIFRDSLFSNLDALTDLAPKLNVTSDKMIDNLIIGMREISNDPQYVRDNVNVRLDIVRRINNLLAI